MKSLLLTLSLLATPAFGYASSSCSSPDGTLRYTMTDSWDHHEQHWYYYGTEVFPNVNDISQRVMLEQFQNHQIWSVKVHAAMPNGFVDSWILCKSE